MAETTPTARSAHLIQGNSSLSRPGAHMARDLPAPTMPIASSDMDPSSRARLWRRAKVTFAVLATFFFFTLGATLLIAAGYHL